MPCIAGVRRMAVPLRVRQRDHRRNPSRSPVCGCKTKWTSALAVRSVCVEPSARGLSNPQLRCRSSRNEWRHMSAACVSSVCGHRSSEPSAAGLAVVVAIAVALAWWYTVLVLLLRSLVAAPHPQPRQPWQPFRWSPRNRPHRSGRPSMRRWQPCSVSWTAWKSSTAKHAASSLRRRSVGARLQLRAGEVSPNRRGRANGPRATVPITPHHVLTCLASCRWMTCPSCPHPSRMIGQALRPHHQARVTPL